jgi:ketosteroid isomerase-like protein
MRELAEQYFAAVNAEDFDALGAVFAPDVEIHTTGTEPVVGRDAALAHFRSVLANYPEHLDAVTRWIEAPDAVVCEIAFTGRLADGREIRFDALDVFDAGDRGITRVSTWYDTRSVARQVRG